MKKFTSKLLIATILSLSLFPQTTFAAFPDVPNSHKNHTAIEFLQNNNTINGYPDGTFKPDNSINRAEFLKLIIEGSSIPTDISTNTPFPDVDHQAWYGPYIRKAYEQGWIQGYTDGTFRPAQSISKVEAIKIIGESQAWPLVEWVDQTYYDDVFRSMWFAPYVSYAKSNGYLEDDGPSLNPHQEATRGYVSEVIYRSTVNGLLQPFDDSNITPPTEIPPTELEAPTDTGGPSIASTFFENFQLDANIPTTFYDDEVYIIAGNILSGSARYATVILDHNGSNNSQTFTVEIENNEFEIPVHFRESGEYSIGLILGESGVSKAHIIRVLDGLPSPSAQNPEPTLNSNSIAFADDSTFVTFSADPNTIKKLTFTQGGDQVTYYSRQNLGYIPVQYRDFQNFNTGSANYKLDIASTSSSNPLVITSNFNTGNSNSFTALDHTFSEITPNFTSTSLPELLSPGQDITISGTMFDDFQLSAAIILPDGTVDHTDITTNASNIVQGEGYVVSGSSFSVDYDPPSPGTYIFEINDRGGIALINHPIYVNNGYPLIPDFFDLNDREFYSAPFNQNSLRQEMLNLINQVRSEFGLAAVDLSSELNSLAQAHTDDMAQNNFFAHVNLSGQSPDDRRIAAGIETPVGENLARDVSLEFAHYGLLKSAIHRENILTPEWDRVGIGITEQDGYLIIAQEFSTNPLTPSDLEDQKAELYETVNNLRSDLGLDELDINSSLEQASEHINDLMIDDGQEIDNQSFNDTLAIYNVTGNSEALLRVHPSWQEILDSILEDPTIINELWEKIGINIQLDENGYQYLFLILNRL